MQRRLSDYFVIALKGIAMGAADVIPGVSGGTIAFISGIYEELIQSIDNLNIGVFKTWKESGFKAAWLSINGNFLLAVFGGIFFSILSLAKLIKWMLLNEPILLWSFFFGLVLSSIIFIAKQINHWNTPIIFAIIATSVLSYFITLAEPFASPDSGIYLMFCGFIAIIAMILPGISGAFILLILGVYKVAIDTINNVVEGLINRDFELFKEAFINFMLIGIGAIIGLKVFSKILNWMFQHKKNITLGILTGFMIGSLNKIWPWKETLTWRIDSHNERMPFLEKSISPFSFDGDNQILYATLLMALGFLTIFMLEKFGSKKQ